MENLLRASNWNWVLLVAFFMSSLSIAGTGCGLADERAKYKAWSVADRDNDGNASKDELKAGALAVQAVQGAKLPVNVHTQQYDTNGDGNFAPTDAIVYVNLLNGGLPQKCNVSNFRAFSVADQNKDGSLSKGEQGEYMLAQSNLENILELQTSSKLSYFSAAREFDFNADGVLNLSDFNAFIGIEPF